MDTLFIVIVALVAVNLALTVWGLFYWLRHRRVDSKGVIEAGLESMKADLIAKQMEGLVSLQKSLESANRLVSERLAEGTQTLDRRMAVVSDIENKLGQLSTQAKNIETIGRNIQSLSDLLKPPKMRGSLGETLLENLLAQILPHQLYETQYKFPDGGRVDAIVKIHDRLLPIDSKFPLESFQRMSLAETETDQNAAQKDFKLAIKKHVDDISSKYLKPDQSTTEIALMYIPSEAVYYQLVSNSDLDSLDYALSKKVIPSCPGHLYAFLASVAAVYAELGLTENRRELVHTLAGLEESLGKLQRYNERISGSLRSASLSLEKSNSEISGMTYQVQKIRQPESDSEN